MICPGVAAERSEPWSSGKSTFPNDRIIHNDRRNFNQLGTTPFSRKIRRAAMAERGRSAGDNGASDLDVGKYSKRHFRSGCIALFCDDVHQWLQLPKPQFNAALVHNGAHPFAWNGHGRNDCLCPSLLCVANGCFNVVNHDIWPHNWIFTCMHR